MIRTDFHVHAFPPGMVPEPIQRARAVSRAVRLGRDSGDYVDTLVRRMQENIEDPDGDLLRRDLEGAGFQRATVIGIDWGLVGGDITELSPEAELDWARQVAERHQDFFSVIYGIDPRRPNAAKLARDALSDGALAGIKLYPPAGFSPTSEECDPIYEAVTEAGAIAMFHTGRQTYPFDIAHGRIEPYAEVQRRFPAMRIVLGHAGWPFWGREAIEVASGHPTTWIEVSSWQREIDTDLPRVQRFLRQAWRDLGPRRVLFGSDGYSGPRSTGPGAFTPWKQVFEETAQEGGVDLEQMEAGVDELLS